MTRMTAVALRTLLCAQLLATGLVVGAEDPRNVPDPTPPPLGTASFVPPSNIDEEPLLPQSFVTSAALINMAEMEIGQMARSKSADAAVKEFGSHLAADHRAALAKLKAIAAEAKIALPGELDPEHQALRDELSALDGAAFDRRFVAAMVEGHGKAVKMFGSAAKSAKLTPALRAYAESTLPTLRQHAQMAQRLQSAH